MKRISIFEEDSGKDKRFLDALVDEKGDLVLEGYDIGETAEKYRGDKDYEYWIRVEKEDVPAMLLHLLKERFPSSSAFMAWCKERDIPFHFTSY